MYDLQLTHRGLWESGAHVLTDPGSYATSPDPLATVALRSTAASNAGEEPPQLAPASDGNDDGWDDVYDASVDSFPASDPPPWMSMRIGGPSRTPAAVPVPSPHVAHESSSAAATSGRPFDGAWIERSWPNVRVAHAELRLADRYWNGGHSVLRAVVHLGALTPADVCVIARRRGLEPGSGSGAPLRLSSVASLHNDAVVFESGMVADALDDASAFTVVVEPAKVGPNSPGLRRVARDVTTQTR